MSIIWDIKKTMIKKKNEKLKKKEIHSNSIKIKKKSIFITLYWNYLLTLIMINISIRIYW